MKRSKSIRRLAMLIGTGMAMTLGLALPVQAELPDSTRISKPIADKYVHLVSGLPKATGVKRITDKLQRRYEKLMEKQTAYRERVRECEARKWTRRQQQIAGCTASDSARQCQARLMQRCTRGVRQHLTSAKARFLDTVDRDVAIIRKKVADMRIP